MQIKSLPLKAIVAGQNPRTFFDPAEMAELESSVRANGLLQPIVVRQKGDVFEIIAGERRFRAVKAVEGDDGEIAAIIRDCSNEEAETLALIENISRADMSPTEEAAAAHRLYVRLRDKNELAAQLGWPLSKLERRLALMNCCEAVRVALNERKILLGHAELLAALHAEKQEKALEIVLTNNLSVVDFKRSLTNLAQKLDEAIFDKADCLSCPHNSGTQSALFTENIGDGSCTHPTCYQQKTATHLDGIKSNLERVVNRVEFLELGEDKIIPIKLVTDGLKGVGEDQMNACKGCASFGATVSKLPGELGKIEQSICFDGACHTEKVSTYLESLKAEQAPESTKGKEKSVAAAVTGSSTTARIASSAAKAGEHRNSIKEYAEKQLRRIAASAVSRTPEKAPELLLWLITAGHARHVPEVKTREAVGKITGTTFKGSPELASLSTALAGDEASIRRGMAATVGYSMMESTLPLSVAKQVLKQLAVDLTKEWKVNAEFLDLLTKAELESFALKNGLKDAIGEDAFKKIFNNKKEDVIAGLMAHADTHFAGKLHEAISL